MTRYLKLMALVCVVFMLSACASGINTDKEKIAVVKWEKIVAGHPEFARLQQGEKIIKNLVLRRDAQLQIAKSQMENVERLRSLKQLSEQSYFEADLHTQLMAKNQINKGKVYRKSRLVDKEVEMQLKPQRQAIEEEYRLRIFNLRMEKERIVNNTRFRDRKKIPGMIAELDQKINVLKLERDARLSALDASKQGLVSEKMQPYLNNLHAELQNFEMNKRQENQEQFLQQEEKYQKLLSAAPKALNSALTIMEKEIAKQQEKNDSLKKHIEADIEATAARLAKERNYTIVLKDYKANVSAIDITNDIVAELKRLKK